MEFAYLIIIPITVLLFLIYKFKKINKKSSSADSLNNKQKNELSTSDIGKLYERYIGYLFESIGCEVEYHGAKNTFNDLGRDLIIKDNDITFIVQTKYWAKHKIISEKHIFQLYGSLIHFRRTSNYNDTFIKAVFYTTANYSENAKEVAKVLGVELRTKKHDKSYPKTKCHVTKNNYRIYLFPDDQSYDQIKMKIKNGDMYVATESEALARGFRRPKNLTEAA